MRHWALFGSLGLAVLSACGQNPLLRSASSDFAPVRVGSQWTYVQPDGSPGFTREVTGSGPAQGREAFTVQTSFGALPPSTALWSLDQGALESYDATLGWTLQRRLPYVPGNKWSVATGTTYTTAVRSVENIENVSNGAGNFEGCFRLKTKLATYDAAQDLTTVTETLVWAAPNVGDIRFASVDAGGNVTVTFDLSSYRIPR